MSDSVRPHRWQPIRLHRPWGSPGRNTGLGCHFLLQWMKVKSEREVTQSCLTLSNPIDWSLPGASVHGIFQARVLEWGAIAFSWFHLYQTTNPSYTLCLGHFYSWSSQGWFCYSLGFSLDVTSSVEINSHLSLSEIVF